MSAYTPGPWTVDAYIPSDIRIKGATGGYIARVYQLLSSRDRATESANGRLIAAAPELLDAAKAALSEMCHTVATRDSFTDAADALDAAIAKAEGRS